MMRSKGEAGLLLQLWTVKREKRKREQQKEEEKRVKCNRAMRCDTMRCDSCCCCWVWCDKSVSGERVAFVGNEEMTRRQVCEWGPR